MYCTTLSEARDNIIKLCETQIESALLQRAAPNTRIVGDHKVKQLFLGMLDYKHQKEVYHHVINSYERCQRAVPLFGAPPYHFLDYEANLMYNASAFSSTRKHMAYTQAMLNLPNSNQFGAPHYKDDKGRLYRVCYEFDKKADHPMPKQYVDSKNSIVYFYIKGKRVEGARHISVPKIGETITLSSTEELDAFENTRKSHTISTKIISYTTNTKGGTKVVFLLVASAPTRL